MNFNESPFNPVDNIIFSQLSYLSLDGIVPGPDEKEGISIALAVKIYNENMNKPGFKMTSIFKEDPDLIKALAASERFGNCQLFGHVSCHDEKREIQFSALCVHTSDNHCFVTFRGTDTSLVGWKEDFNMCFRDVIPSQTEAVNYLEKMAPMINGHLRVGGHSKGGNLAIYASSKCGRKTQKRITEIYSNDAPGFNEKMINDAGFTAVKDRIHSYVPQSSIIGMLLEHGYGSAVIKSSESGLLQHSLYSWEVTHNDLVRAEKSTESSRFINKTLKEWLDSLDNKHREEFIESLYHILYTADVKSLQDLESSWFSAAGRVIKSLGAVEESKRKLIKNTLSELFLCAGRNIENYIKQKKNEQL